MLAAASAMSRPGVVVVGGMLLLDHVALLPELPGPGETVRVRDLHYQYSTPRPGGCSANIAVAATRAGAATTLLAVTATDAEALEYQAYLRRTGICVDYLIIDRGRSTPRCYTWYAPDGTKYACMDELRPVDAIGAVAPGDEVDEVIDDSAAVVLVGGGEDDSMSDIHAKVAERASRGGSRVVIAICGTPRPVDQELLRTSDAVIGNELEIAAATAQTGCRTEAQLAREAGVTLFVTRGSKGSRVCEPGARSRDVAAIDVSSAIDPTGAGDAYAGGVAVALARGATAVEAACFGTALASFAVERTGAQTRAPRNHEIVERFETAFSGTIPEWLAASAGAASGSRQ